MLDRGAIRFGITSILRTTFRVWFSRTTGGLDASNGWGIPRCRRLKRRIRARIFSALASMIRGIRSSWTLPQRIAGSALPGNGSILLLFPRHVRREKLRSGTLGSTTRTRKLGTVLERSGRLRSRLARQRRRRHWMRSRLLPTLICTR